MAENVINSDRNLPEPPRARLHTIPDGQGQSHCSRARAAALLAVLLVIILLLAIALYLTLTTGSQQDSTALTSSSQNVSAPLSPSSQEESTELPPSHEEAPGKSCCSTTRVAVLVTEIIVLLLIVVCQILPCKSHYSRTQLSVLVVVLVPIVVALTLSWTLPHGQTAGSRKGSTTLSPTIQEDTTTLSHIPERGPGCPPAWKKHGRKCYFFFPEREAMDWNASRAECTAMGSDLVVIDSREELSYLLSQSSHNYYFLGLTRSPAEQKWKWINNVEHDPAMFRILGYYRELHCTVIGFGEVSIAPCGGTRATQNMCEKAATISNRHL
ncbi:C-type lectin domain family 5 member A-like [Ammospiza nelsoni]|uniref:C-type lectin domain family 5 member A-like n=1 Tax=Ammospiza caudacuta TaxID=2857398 RepID=UPI00273863E3|nr:C-type lectin domain family 5 member A-like [Ammospiza caudacuta]XP_059328624.1 C-type lectin domain family 5 member A-like [Ammospiza nelsoni]XP_059328625.1 C-type lectin domain family 5 member A-like [Ammospiza nelsoni]